MPLFSPLPLYTILISFSHSSSPPYPHLLSSSIQLSPILLSVLHAPLFLHPYTHPTLPSLCLISLLLFISLSSFSPLSSYSSQPTISHLSLFLSSLPHPLLILTSSYLAISLFLHISVKIFHFLSVVLRTKRKEEDISNRPRGTQETTMPRYTVHVRGEWLAVPCKDGSDTIRWLGKEALRRYIKNRPDNGGFDSVEDVKFYLRRCKGLGLLDLDDMLKDALDDNEFVEVVMEGDVMSPDFIPSQPEGVHLYSKYKEPDEYIYVDGNSLSTEDLINLGKGLYKIKLSSDAEHKVTQARQLIESIVEEKKVVYGITTGFGKFARTVIPISKLKELQENLVRSHSAGIGKPLSPDRTRMLLALRINVLAKGYSGISLETLQQVIAAFNASCLPYIPEKGTVGASGDLAPLSHLTLGLIGEGKMWSPKSGWADAKYVLQAHGLKQISLKPKEGLALINGTQMITSLGCEAVERANAIAKQADIVAALTLEVLKGTTKAFDTDIHALRPHPGQVEVAFRFRSLLDSDHHPSEIAESHRFCDRVQDAYTLRCCPQVHGVVNDTIAFVRNIITTEINSATDNPMVFAERGETISGGNFHGEYPAKALDYLAIGVHELAAISERRIERLCNPSLSELPAFLVTEGGLNSGFMIAHCTAAALVSENKALCHPSSVDSLSTSAATEDHVSMGGWAARKALRVIEHVEHVLGIELLAACQGIEFLRPLRTTTPLEKVYDLVRSVVRPWMKDRFMAPDIDAVHRLLVDQKIWHVAAPYIEKYRMEHIPESRPVSPTAFSVDSSMTLSNCSLSDHNEC